MPDPEVLQQMREDWNQRAREDARYYVAGGRRGQQDEEFFASAGDVVRLLEDELKRLPSNIPPQARRGLEVLSADAGWPTGNTSSSRLDVRPCSGREVDRRA